MNESKDVSPLNSLTGMAVVALTTGNRLGQVQDLFIDPVNGILIGLTLTAPDGGLMGLPYDEIYSFGNDAIMAHADESIRPLDMTEFADGRHAKMLFGTKIITESGNVLGQITNIYVTLNPPPFVLYELRRSILDKLLGREFFIPASAAHTLSDDSERLIVSDVTAEAAASDLTQLVDEKLSVRTFTPPSDSVRISSTDDEDKTWVWPTEGDEDQTILRSRDDENVVRSDDDETILRWRDDDTVVRRPRTAA